jgi:hypothetical protein
LIRCSAGAALIVKSDDVPRTARRVGDDEADARKEFAEMPLNLGNDSTWLRPTCRLIPKGRIDAPHRMRRAPDGSFEQRRDPILQDLIGWQPDRIINPLRFKVLVNARRREGGITTKRNASAHPLITFDDRL